MWAEKLLEALGSE